MNTIYTNHIKGIKAGIIILLGFCDIKCAAFAIRFIRSPILIIMFICVISIFYFLLYLKESKVVPIPKSIKVGIKIFQFSLLLIQIAPNSLKESSGNLQWRVQSIWEGDFFVSLLLIFGIEVLLHFLFKIIQVLKNVR